MLNALVLFYLRRILRLNSPARIIEFSLKKYKNQTFLIEPERGLTLSFHDLAGRVAARIAEFKKNGLGRGDVLAFQSANCSAYFEVRAACHLAGVVFMGLPPSLAQEDVEYFLAKAKAKALFENRDVSNFQTLAGAGKLETSRFSTLNLSSGTTAKTPKIVQLTDENWVESLYGYMGAAKLGGERIIFLCTLPFVTAGSTTFLPTLLAGATQIILKEGAPPETIVEYVRKYRVNRLYVTPSRLVQILDWCRRNNYKMETLRQVIVGTEGLPEARFKEAIEFFGPIIYRGYGMVEVLPPVSLLGPNDYHKPKSVGKVLPGVQVKVDHNGRLCLKSKTVSPGYLDNPEENAKCFQDGWFFSNDYGCMDAHGYLYVYGRKEDILAEHPDQVFCGEVEEVISQIAEVRHCGVVRRDDRSAIFVVLRREVPPEDLKRLVARQIESASLRDAFSRIFFPKIVVKQELPVNALGKLDRRLLAEEI